MRVIITLFTLILTFLPNISNAQKVNWGPDIKKEGGLFGIVYLAGMTDTEYSVVVRPKKRNEIVTYNHSHKLISTDQIDLKIGNEVPYIKSIIQTTSSQFALMTVQNKQKKKLEVYASKMNKGKLGKPILVHAHEYKKRILSLGILDFTSFTGGVEFQGLIHSIDKSKVVYLSYSPAKKKEKNALSIVVFDENMNKLWKKKMSFPYDDRDFSIEQINLTDEGKLILAGRLDITKKGKAPNYDFKIFEISEAKNENHSFKLKGGKLPSDLGLLKSGPDAIQIGGTYTDAEFNKRIDGVFFGTLDLKTGDVQSKSHPFSKSFLEGLVKERKIKKGKGLESSYYVKEFLTFEDGSYSFIAENYYLTSQTRRSGNSTTRITIYHSDEIIIPHFSSDGELINIDKIEKDFGSEIPTFCSYRLAKHNGKVFLVYNDRKKRAERKEIGKKNSLFTDIAIINNKGVLETQKTLFTSKDEGIETLYSPVLSQSLDNKMILFGFSGTKYQFGSLKFE